MRAAVVVVASLALGACASANHGGRVIPRAGGPEVEGRVPLAIDYFGAEYLREAERKAARDEGRPPEACPAVPPGGVLVVSTAVGSAEHADPANFVLTVAAGDRPLGELRRASDAVRACGYGCGPTTGSGRLRRRAPCFCSAFVVELPDAAPRYVVRVTDATDGAEREFDVRVNPAGEREVCQPDPSIDRSSAPRALLRGPTGPGEGAAVHGPRLHGSGAGATGTGVARRRVPPLRASRRPVPSAAPCLPPPSASRPGVAGPDCASAPPRNAPGTSALAGRDPGIAM